MNELSEQIRAWTNAASLGQEHQLTAEDILDRHASGPNLRPSDQQPRRSRGAVIAAVAALFVAALGTAGIIYAQTKPQPTGVTAAGRDEGSESDQTTSGSSEVRAPGVGAGRYNPEALAAASPPTDVSTAETVVVMEARNICQRVHDYSTGATTSAAASDAIDESTAAAAAASTPDQPVDVSQFADFAKTRITDAEAESSPGPAEDFIRSECDSSQDYSIRVLANS